MDVFFYETFAEELRLLKDHLPDTVTAGFSSVTVQDDPISSPPAGLICIRTQSVIPTSWKHLLQGVLTRSTGYDHIQSLHSDLNIRCGYLPHYCSRAVAEQAMVLWTALFRKLPAQAKTFSVFNRDGLTGRECMGRTLLVVGVGNIGYEVCRLGEALGMNVVGVDIVQRHSDVRYVSLEEGLAQADVIVCAMNLTDDNMEYFDHETLRKARHGCVFINIARGELSPLKALVRLMEEGHLGGVALDVFEHESELSHHLRTGEGHEDGVIRSIRLLTQHDNVILTPHNAFNTEEALMRKVKQTIEQIEAFHGTGEFLWPLPD
ncbi:MAG: NAD(P)-dependent oxidoreductase [Desulfomonilia bacterium]